MSSFKLVEVDNQGFQIQDEDGNAIASVSKEDVVRLAVDATFDQQSTRISNAPILGELRLIRRELKAMRLMWAEATEEDVTSGDIDTEETP